MAIPVGGLATGLDTEQLIERLLALERRPITLLETRKLKFQALSTVFQDLNKRLGAVKTAAEALRDPATFFPRTVSSSTETVATATAAPGSTTGTYTLTVSSLARGSLAAAATTKSALTDTVATTSGNFQFKLGATGPVVSVAVDTTTTLDQLAKAINDKQAGVKASIVNTGTTAAPAYKLTLLSVGTGAANNIAIVTDPTTLSVGNTQTATDAAFTIAGLGSFTRGTNSFSDVIDGVTITLKAGTGTTDLAVNVDKAGTQERVKTLVSAYNDVVTAISSQTRGKPDLDGKPTPGALTGDVVPRQILRNLAAVLAGNVGGRFDTLARVGLTTERDGTMTLDAGKFQKALNDDPEAVRALVAGTSTTDGIADRLVSVLADATKAVSGAIAARQDGINASIKSIQRQIDAAEERIETSERILRARFTTLERVMSDIQTTGSSLLSQLQTLSRQTLSR